MRSRGSWLERFERHAKRTFADAAAKYLKEYRGKDKGRLAYALKALNPYVSHLLLMDVNDDALSQFKHDRLNGLGAFERKATASTVNLEITLVSTILNCACREWEWLPRSLKLRHVQGPKKQPYPLTWEQQDALFACIPERWAEGFALFGVNTGVRPDEWMGLRWDCEVKIPALETFIFVLHETKNGEARAVICNSLARLAVERQRGNDSEYVFPSESNRTRGERMVDVSRAWYNGWKAAGLPTDQWTRRGPHNLRHTFGHRLREAGVSDEDRAALMGHKKASIQTHYAMPEIRRLLELAELVTRRTAGGVILRRMVA